MEFSAYLQAGLVAAAERLVKRYRGDRTADSVAAMEQGVQGGLARGGVLRSERMGRNPRTRLPG